MLYEISHRTAFTYGAPVFLEPHLIRLRPRSDGTQVLQDYSLTIEPAPAGRTEMLDLDGNSVTCAWFTGVTPALTLVTRSVVRTCRENPWDYLPVREAELLPLHYPPSLAQCLLPYRFPNASSEPVARLAERVSHGAGGSTIRFLSALCETLYDRIEVVIREEGWPLPPEETLTTGQGSCRDLTLLFMDAARWMGLAARFTSGYQEGDPDQQERHLHAWPEVYIPGAGWRGYDPTLGLAVADRHVALASGPTPQAAAPTEGTFRGTGVTGRMEATIQIRALGGVRQ